jgi:hypothetical protein
LVAKVCTGLFVENNFSNKPIKIAKLPSGQQKYLFMLNTELERLY